MAITQPGAMPNNHGQEGVDDGGEESDEYEVADEEDGEEEGASDDDSGDEEEQGGGGLTAMLLGENIGEGGNYDEDDEGWVPAGGKEPADYSGEEDEDEDKQDESAVPLSTEEPPGKTSNGTAPSSGKKRARECEPTEDERGEEKKTKLLTDSTL